ncbi:MAG: M48 family metallopeptidase [Nitrospirota bacterium]
MNWYARSPQRKNNFIAQRIYPLFAKHGVHAFFFLTITLGVNACAVHETRIITLDEDSAAYTRTVRLLAPLVAAMDVVNKKEYQFLIVEDTALNAYVTGYTIVIHSGVLKTFNDDELMCILAHEIAHVSLEHYQKKTRASRSRDLLFQKSEHHDPDANILSMIFKPAAFKSFSRAHEIEADIESVRAVRSLGRPPEACLHVLLKLQESALKNGDSLGGNLFDTHPSLDTRLQKMRDLLQEK